MVEVHRSELCLSFLYSILFYPILNMLFNSISLLDNVALVIDELMSMEHRWNGTGRKNLNCFEKNLSQWYFIQQNPTNDLGLNPDCCDEKLAANCLS